MFFFVYYMGTLCLSR